MLCTVIMAVYSEIPTKHTNTLYGQNVEFFNVTTGFFRCLIPVGFYDHK
jgi:hypothetical protein